MQIEEAIYSLLSFTTTIADYTSDRIYPGVAPQGKKMPYVTYQKVSDPGYHAMQYDANIRSPRFQISTYSTSFSQCGTVAKIVKDTLKDYSGVMGGAGGVTVQRSFYAGEIQFSHIDPEDKSITHHVMTDFIIWYSSS